MNEKVVEIINVLIKRILHEKSQVSPDELITELIRAGYTMPEIDSAFELIFSVPEIIKPKGEDASPRRMTTRVFTPLEQQKITVAARGYLLGLLQQDLISEQEMESVLEEAVSLNTQEEVGIQEIKWLLTQVLEDEWRAYLLAYGSSGGERPAFSN